MSTLHSKKSEQNESGMVAIMVTLILMIVISLIVLGFAQISRRNQRQALDRQLSTQAFYAAETGVNDATKLLNDATAAGTVINAKPDCASDGGGFYSMLNPTIDAIDKVGYTCLTVDPTPPSVTYEPSTTGVVVPVTAASGTISKMTFKLTSLESGNSSPSNGCRTGASSINSLFSSAGSWSCGYGVVRIDLVPTAGSGLSLNGLQSSTMTSFMVPYSSGGSAGAIPYAGGGSNSIIKAPCDNTNCTVTISALGSTQYYLRITSLYKPTRVDISITDASSNPLNIQGAQAVIDVTGKAQDVLRRIQVRVPLSGSSKNQLSDYAIQSTEAICKRFSVMDGYFKSDANAQVPGVGASTTNPLCQ